MYKIYKPDNTFEVLNLTVKSGYGEMYIHDNSTPQTLTNQNQFYVVTATWTTGSCSGFTADASNNSLICNVSGEYQLSCQLNYNGGNNEAYVFAIFVNGVRDTSLTVHTDARLLTQTISSPMMGLISLNKDDTIDLRAECTSNAGTSIIVVHSNISVARAIKV